MHLFAEYFADSFEPLEAVTPGVPFSEELEVCIKIVVSQNPKPGKANDYVVELHLYNVEETEQFEPMLGSYKNCPVKVPFDQLLDIIPELYFDYQILWCSPVRTIASAGQFLQSLLPFLEVSRRPNEDNIYPTIMPIPGGVIPEPKCVFRGIECYICSYHVNENNLRLVISPFENNQELMPILVDLEYEMGEFTELFILKNRSANDIYLEYKEYLNQIQLQKTEKLPNNPGAFKTWLRETAAQDTEKTWLDYCVGRAHTVQRAHRAEADGGRNRAEESSSPGPYREPERSRQSLRVQPQVAALLLRLLLGRL